MTRYSDSTVTLTRSEQATLYAAMIPFMDAVDSDFLSESGYTDAVRVAELDLDMYPVLPSEPVSDQTIGIWYSAINYYMDTVARTPAAVALSDDLRAYI